MLRKRLLEYGFKHRFQSRLYDSIPDRNDTVGDLKVARTVIDQTVAGVLAGIPASGKVDNQAIATAVAVELAKRLGNG